MTTFVQHLINAFALGSLVSLFALGLAMVYSVLGVLNFAYGELITVCAYTIVLLGQRGVSFWWAIPFGILAAIVVAIATELIAFRRLRKAPPAAVLFSSFAVAIIIQNLIRQLVSPRPQGVVVPQLFDAAWHIGPIVIPAIAAITAGISLSTSVALVAFLQRSKAGLGLRAAADDFAVARLLGVRANRVILQAFVLSGLTGGIAGVLWLARLGTATPTMGFDPILLAFVASVVGGLGTLRGAALGGYLVGGGEVLLTAVLPNEARVYTDAVVMAIVVAFLFFRPDGLIRSPQGRLA